MVFEHPSYAAETVCGKNTEMDKIVITTKRPEIDFFNSFLIHFW